MENVLNVLLENGVLGCWIVWSLIREKWLLKKIEENRHEFQQERMRWDRERTRWMRILGRKLSENTFIETYKD